MSGKHEVPYAQSSCPSPRRKEGDGEVEERPQESHYEWLGEPPAQENEDGRLADEPNQRIGLEPGHEA